MKTLAITGHRGLLGSACVKHFKDKREIIPFEGNCLNETHVERFFNNAKPDEVIHCAAKVGGVEANKNHPVAFLQENLLMQCNVISAAAHHQVEKLVFIGTSCMFPRDAELPVREDSLLTGRLDDSIEAYAVAKIAGWRLCKAYWEEHGKKFMTVNPSNIYGDNDNYGPAAHVIPALIRKFRLAQLTGEAPVVWGDGSAVREFIHSSDVAAAIEVVLAKWNSPEVLSIGTGVGHTIRELVETLERVTEIGIPVVWDTSKPVGIPRKTFDVTQLRMLGWAPTVELEVGLQTTWTDFRNTPLPRGLQTDCR
ncbi:MAG: NAD-dependent epimerase/dehydratase family protein [Terrimicrobiaceae bacterium]|jgi:GDP-L-fucose synthase|nr:NAD-dependent epimerase/dehydratase family protein [Terrimicrobiaceae bacterium]